MNHPEEIVENVELEAACRAAISGAVAAEAEIQDTEQGSPEDHAQGSNRFGDGHSGT